MPEYAALDLETTGLDPARDRVIEVGAVAFTPEHVTTTLERLVDPGRAVPETVLRLTGIKPEELRGAASADSALRELADFLHGRQPVGHGARLDVDFLLSAGLWPAGREILDTLDIARILMPGSRVRLAAGRKQLSPEAMTLCFLAGANSIFVGEKLLTTPNPGPDEDAQLLQTLGLKPLESHAI